MDLSSSMLLDALPGPAAVLDTSGRIETVNQAWRDFGRANGLASPNDCVGMNYLAVCDAAAGRCSAGGAATARELRALLAGRRSRVDYEYPCPAPRTPRWFKMSAGLLRDGDRIRGALVSHVELTTFGAHALRELTERDKQILAAMTDGRGRAEVARSHGLTEVGLNAYVGMLLRRLSLRNRPDAARLGLEIADFEASGEGGWRH